MIKLKPEEHTYTRYVATLTPELLEYLENRCKKKVMLTNDPTGIHSKKLCAFALESVTEKDIEENLLYSLIQEIKATSLEEIKLFSIECVGTVVDTERYVPYSLYVLRSNI